MKLIKKYAPIVFVVISLAALGALLYLHLQMGLRRYFDSDEYAHLFWGYQYLIGQQPYRDFFYIIPPFFLIPIAITLGIFGRTFAAIIAVRVVMFFVFALTSLVVFLLVRFLSGRTVALFTVLIFNSLILVTDKMIEIRPDLISLLCMLAGMYLFVRGYDKKSRFQIALSGLLYAGSLGFVPKVAFAFIPLGIVMGLFLIRAVFGISKEFGRLFTPFFAGALVSGGLFILMLLRTGALGLALFSMTRIAKDTTTVLGGKFFMFPSHFFYPNDVFYGWGGESLPYWLNYYTWLFALPVGIALLMVSLRFAKNSVCLGHFIAHATFFSMVYAHIYAYPLKHSQYLMPITPFISFYCAFLLVFLARQLTRINQWVGFIGWGVSLSILAFMVVTGAVVINQKTQWLHLSYQIKLEKILAAVPKDDPVYDLTGETVFYPSGAYYCCLPYGQYWEVITIPYPGIVEDLKKRNTKWAWLSFEGRIGSIPASHQEALISMFSPRSDGGFLWRRK